MGSRIAWRDSLSRLIPLLILCFLILCFCQDLILQEQVPFFRDLGPYFYPLRFTLYESFRSGELPLWNRHIAMGFPLLAAFQSGVFYPPHLFDSVFLCSYPRNFCTPLLNSRDRSLLSLPKLEISSLLVNRWCVVVRARGYGCFPEQLAESLSNRSLAALGHFELGETS